MFSKINEEYEDSKLRLKPKLNNGIMNQSWDLKEDHRNLNIRNQEELDRSLDENSQDQMEQSDGDDSHSLLESLSLEGINLRVRDLDNKKPLPKSNLSTKREYGLHKGSLLHEKIHSLQEKIDDHTSPNDKGKKFKRNPKKPRAGLYSNKKKSSKNSIILSAKKRRRPPSAWKCSTDVKPSAQRSFADIAPSQVSQNSSIHKLESINDKNIYKNLKAKNSRPLTANKSVNQGISRKSKMRSNVRIMNFYESYQQNSREVTPARTVRREVSYSKSLKKNESRLKNMKKLCRHTNKSINANGPSLLSTQGVRPQSVDYRSFRKVNASFDTTLVNNSPERVEPASPLKTQVLNEEELMYIFQAKCKDLGFPVNVNQFERFKRYIHKESKNGKLKMINLGLSTNTIHALYDVMLTNQKIKRLYLSKNKLKNEGAKVISKIIKTTSNIIHLDISSNGINHIGLDYIVQSLLRSNTLVSLNLSSTDMSNKNRVAVKGAKLLAKLLRKSPYIQFLNLNCTALCNPGIKENINLISLSLKGNEITNESSKIIAEVLNSSALEYLDLSDNNFGNPGINELSYAIRSEKCKLRILKLKNCGFNYQGAHDLFNCIKYSRSIKDLYLDKNRLTSPNYAELRSLLWTNISLRLFSLNECQIGDKGATAIAEGLIRNNTLTHLHLRNNDITDLPGKEILQTLYFPRTHPLETLNLANNLLGSASSDLLVTLLPNLKNPPKKLNLENNLLKTHKYKILRVFLSHGTANASQVEKYMADKRQKYRRYFGSKISKEKAEFMNDPVEYEQTQKALKKYRKKKNVETSQIPDINAYINEEMEQQERKTKMTEEQVQGISTLKKETTQRAADVAGQLKSKKEEFEKQVSYLKIITKNVISDQGDIEEEIKYVKEQLEKHERLFKKKEEQLNMEITRVDAMRSIAEKKFMQTQRLHQNVTNTIQEFLSIGTKKNKNEEPKASEEEVAPSQTDVIRKRKKSVSQKKKKKKASKKKGKNLIFNIFNIKTVKKSVNFS
ncbi:unnamed protein product [Moneuplotes crassus]|uniref:Uncharacterized protein n=2 Tax=Euplotes crassus TaxID=5936 RepID=A0AAD2D0L4_EUPCR|nr:unnamed protein product [Moneuplotes crassus]